MSYPKWALNPLIIAASTAVAVLGREAFDWYFGPMPAFLFPFLLPVVVTGWYAGTRWGLVATVLNTAIAALYCTSPVSDFHTMSFDDRVRLGGFVTVGAVLSGLTGSHRRYRGRVEHDARTLAQRNIELEREVAVRRETERLLELRVNERTVEIETQKRLLDAVLDALPVAVIIADPTGRFVRVNRACYNVCGAVPQAAGVEDYPAWVGYWPGTGRRVEPMEWPLSRAVFAGEFCTDQIEIERFGDNARRTLQISAAPVHGSDGAVIAGVVAGVDVTEQKQVADVLRESERKFRAVFHTQFQFIGLMSPDGVLLEANRTALAAARVPEHEVLGKPFWETAWWTHDPAQQDRLRDAVRRAAAGQPDRFEASHPHADGTLMWVDFSLTPYRHDGCVVLLIPEGRDITERKQAEAAVRASERRFQAFMTHAPIAAWIVDAESRGIYTSPGFDRHLGLPSGSYLGKRPADLWPMEIAGAYVENDRRVLADEVAVETEEPFVHPDGSPGFAHVVKFPMSGPDGEQLIGGVAIDITARHRAEAAVRESEDFTRTVLDALPALIAVVDRAGTITAVNRNWEGFAEKNPVTAGVAPRIGVGVGVGYLAVCDDSATSGCPDAALAAVAIREVLAGGGSRTGIEYDFHAPQERRWFSMSVFPLTSPAGGAVISHTNITSRRLAEESVRNSEEQFRNSFEFAPIGMALVAPDGKWLRANHALCEMIGYIEAGLVATDLQAITHPDDLDADLGFVRQMLAGTLPAYQMEKRYIHKRGHVVYVLLSVSLVRDVRGNPLHFISQIMDITRRKEDERALAANEALLRQFIKHSPAAIAMFDREVRYVHASDRWLNDYHLGDREIIGLSHYEVFPDLPDHWKAVHKRVLAGAVQGCDEDPFHRADGSTEWLQWECRPWLGADGGVGGLIMFTQVITERKRAEAALQLSEERFRRLVDGVADHAIFMLDTEGRVLSWNPAAVKIKGYMTEEIVGRHFSVFYTPEAVVVGHPQLELNAAVAEGRYHEEGERVRKDGSRFWAAVTISTLYDDAGRHVGFVKFTHDISQRKRAEELALASLKEKEVMLKEIHHRVKNNLQIVSALLELQAEHTTDATTLGMFEQSRRRVKSMALVHERLYQSQDIARVDFTEYVRQLAEDLYHSYKVSDDDIRLELTVDIPPLPIDIAIPCGLLLNELMSNCFKHAFKDAAVGCLRVSLHRVDDGTNVLVVSDDGAGFPAGTDFRNTTSFGLQLVGTLVKQLNGEVELTTDGGTTFTVRFPKTKKRTPTPGAAP